MSMGFACINHLAAYVPEDTSPSRVRDGAISVRQPSPSAVPLPAEIYSALVQDVVGQDMAAYSIAVAAHQHYRRIRLAAEGCPVEVNKTDVLLLGPTGSGKTELARSLARFWMCRLPSSTCRACRRMAT
jgi:ATP-dependent protease Clp ATPase subunit